MSGPDDFRLWRMSKIDEWRSSAFALGGPVGNVLSRSFDLIHTVMRDGVRNERSLGYALESLQRERELAMTRDTEREDTLRRLVYGLTESMGAMLECIVEDNHGAPGSSAAPGAAAMTVTPAAAGDAVAAAALPPLEWAASESDNGFLKEEEPLELFGSNLADQKMEEPEEMNNPDEKNQKESSNSIIDDDQASSSKKTTSQSSRSVSMQSDAPSAKRSRSKKDSDDEWEDVSEGKWRSVTTSTRLRPRGYAPRSSSSARSKRRSCVLGRKRYFDSDGEEVEGYYDYAIDEDFEALPSPAKLEGFRCSECDRHFETSGGLKNHSRTHKMITCALCNKEVAALKLAQHVVEMHPKRMETRRSLGSRSTNE